MLLRIRWFVMGALASVGFVAYLATQLRKARERMTTRNFVNSGMRGVANAFDRASAALDPNRDARP